MSKSDFRNWVCSAPEVNECTTTDLPPINVGGGDCYKAAIKDCKLVVVDMLTWLAGINPSEDGTTAGEMAKRLRNSMASVSNGRIAVFAVDKRHVPMAKSVTQSKRKAQQAAYSKAAQMAELELQLPGDVREQHRLLQLPDDVRQNIPRDRTFQMAVDEGIIHRKHSEPIVNGEARREKRLNFHKQRVRDLEEQRRVTQNSLTLIHADVPSVAVSMRHVDVHGLTLTQRALLAVDDTALPRPWPDVMSMHRDALLRYLVRTWMCAPNGAHLCPRRNCTIIIDGHCMTREQWPVATDEQLGRKPPCRKSNASLDDVLQQDMDTPLMFMHPEDAREAEVMNDNVNLAAWQERQQQSEQDHVAMDSATEAMEFRHTTIMPSETEQDPEYLLDMQMSALLFGSDNVDARPRPAVVPLTNMRNRVGEADFVVFFYALELLKMHDNLPRAVEIVSADTDIFVLGLWFLYKWQNDMFAPHYSTRGLPLPTLLHTSGRGWSTAGAKYGTVNITAAYQRLVTLVLNDDCHRIPMLIAAVVSAVGDYTCAGYSGITVKRFITTAISYQTYSVVPHTINQPYLSRLVTFEWVESRERWMPCVHGSVFGRLIRAVFFDRYRTAFEAHYMNALHPWDLTLDQVRTLVNQHVTKSLPHELVTNPNAVSPGVQQHERLMRALRKRMPPDDQLRVRALSLLHVMLMYNDVGLDHVCQYDLTQLGFAVIDPARPIACDNIKSLATDDWEERDAKFFKMHGVDPKQ